MKKTIGSALVLFFFIFTYCSDNNPTSNKDMDTNGTEELFSLRVGNQWTYNCVQYDALDNIIEQSTCKLILDTMENREGNEWFHSKYVEGIGMARLGGDYFSNQPDGIWFRDNFGDVPVLYFKYPVKNDDTWPVYSISGTMKSSSKSITINSKVYSCFYYVFSDNQGSRIEEECYITKDIGIVKQIIYSYKISTGLMTTYTVSELVGYSLK